MWVAQAYAQNDISRFFKIYKPKNFLIEDLGKFISSLAGFAIIIAGILVFAYLVWGGLEYITSGGDKGKVESARARITSALIGLTIVAASWAIMMIIAHFFGLPIFGNGWDIETPY